MTRRLPALALALAVTAGCSPGVRREPLPQAGLLAFVAGGELRVQRPGNAPAAVWQVPPGSEVIDLALSPDGRYVGWVHVRPYGLTLSVHDTVDGRTGHTEYRGSPEGLVATRGAFVVAADRERLLWADAAGLLDGAQPRSVPLGPASPSVLAADGARVLVAAGETSRHGGPLTVYEVTPDGEVTRLFADGDELPEGTFRNMAIGAAALAGDRLVYVSGTSAGRQCEFAVEVVERDLAAGREVASASPPAGHSVTSLALGADGRMLAAAGPVKRCGATGTSALFEVADGTWTQVTADAQWGARSRDGRLAVIRDDGALDVDGTRVASGVTRAAWSPR